MLIAQAVFLLEHGQTEKMNAISCTLSAIARFCRVLMALRRGADCGVVSTAARRSSTAVRRVADMMPSAIDDAMSSLIAHLQTEANRAAALSEYAL